MEALIVLAVVAFVLYFIIMNADKVDTPLGAPPMKAETQRVERTTAALPASTISRSLDFLLNLLESLPPEQQNGFTRSLPPDQSEPLQVILEAYRWDRTLPSDLSAPAMAGMRSLCRWATALSLEAHLVLFNALDEVTQAQIIIDLGDYGPKFSGLNNLYLEQGRLDPALPQLRLTMDFKGRMHRLLSSFYQQLATGTPGNIDLQGLTAALEGGLPFYEVFPLLGQDIALVLQ